MEYDLEFINELIQNIDKSNYFINIVCCNKIPFIEFDDGTNIENVTKITISPKLYNYIDYHLIGGEKFHERKKIIKKCLSIIFK